MYPFDTASVARLQTAHKPLAFQVVQDEVGVFFRPVSHHVQADFGILGSFVRVIDPGKPFDLTPPRFGIQALKIIFSKLTENLPKICNKIEY